ncbi:hypothetical protein TraAM80_00648 [Trypanosoma rangeli]|uniref:C3H1-type domain-containing protein n=1 Tax=Trypanosoma rangeli TaxID=5698 RepID=A0A3R7MA77_TRYRA|nr:uncharacterized protein TraAM80_00648 [Trypanosoma rangeli]RNF11814.1 hypothetical protein TraAM80_00648 [Trypanosoma rangeli]|eukprot:RNF11814.1 hypothetical protein TraAM80_00648 [Trypanosoma rangeli]
MRTSPRDMPQQPLYRGGQTGFHQHHHSPHQHPQVMGQRSRNITTLGGSRGGTTGISPHFDRHRTIRLVRPSSNTVVCTRLNRIIPTFAEAKNGAVVCEEFMDNQNCPYGESCTQIHVVKEHTWDFITSETNRSTGLFEHGFIVHCYDPRMTQYYPIPSELVLNTRGSREYVKMYNEYGDNFKAKFKLCDHMLTRGECSLGESCDDIHAIRNDVWNMESTTTHIAEPEQLLRYPRLSANITVRAFEQNSKDSFVDYPGDQVLLTSGSLQYLAAFEAEGTIPKKKMQHCAHFRTNRLCRRGEGCRFLHILTDVTGSLGDSLLGELSPQSISCGDSPTSDITVNPRVRHGGPCMSGGQMAARFAQWYSPGVVDAASSNVNQGNAGALAFNSSGGGTEGSNPGFVAQDEHQTLSVTPPATVPPRVASPNSIQMGMIGKMRMISPTRRNDPYRMHPEGEAPPSTSH